MQWTPVAVALWSVLLSGLVPSGYASPGDTLYPAIHWDHDVTNLENLEPGHLGKMYYTHDATADPAFAHRYAHMESIFHYPAVILDHSAYIIAVQCLGNGLALDFASAESFQYAVEVWQDYDELLFITHSAVCKNSGDGQHRYYVVHNLEVSSAALRIYASFDETSVEGAIADVDIDWGTYEPPQQQHYRSLSTRATETSCGEAPSSTISGFPAAACGSQFDRTLDSKLGYMDWSEDAFSETLQSFAPGLGDYDPADYDDSSDIEYDDTIPDSAPSRLRKRAFKFLQVPFIQKASTIIKDKFVAPIQKVGTALNNVVDQGVRKVDSALSVDRPIFDVYKNWSVSPAPFLTSESPFGPALHIGETSYKKGKANLWCLNCTMSGTFKADGRIKFSLASQRLDTAFVNINSPFKLDLNVVLGLSGEFSRELGEYNLGSVGFPGLSIPNIVAVGPVIRFKFVPSVSASASGAILYGKAIEINQLQGRLDLKNIEASTVRLERGPEQEQKFGYQGEISVKLTGAFPLSIGVGLDVPALKKYGEVTTDLIVEPSLSIEGKLSGKATSGVNEGENDSCEAPLTLEAKGAIAVKVQATPLFSRTLFSRDSPSYKKCYFGNGTSNSAKSTTTTTAISQATTATPLLAALPTVIKRDPASLFERQASSYNNDAFLPVPPTNEAQDFIELRDEISKYLDDPGANADGLSYTSIQDSTAKYVLTRDTKNNLGLVQSEPQSRQLATSFATFDNVTMSDESGDFFWYYPDVMSRYGVSRVRMGNYYQIPRGADVVTLLPVNVDGSESTRGVYVASTLLGGDTFLTMACNYRDGQPTKIFLAISAAQGKAMLESSDLRYTVTGGIVESCTFFPLFAQNASGL